MATIGTSFASGLRQHLARMLSFQHDGRGLPSKGSPVVFMALALHMVLGGLVVLLLPDLEAPDEKRDFVLQMLWFVASYYFIARPMKMVEAMAGALFLRSLFDLVLLATGIFDLHTSGAVAVVSLWFIAAQACLFYRHYQRVHAPGNNKKNQ